MEEKKDWKEELQDIINREMFKEDLMIQIKSLVEQELDRAREEGKGGVLEIFTEEELRVLRFALKVNREGIHTIWDEDTFDTIWKKVGGLPKLKQ